MPIDKAWFPARLKPVAYRVRVFLMSNSGVLLILAAVLVSRGLSYLPWWYDGDLHPLDVVATPRMAGWVWLLAGLFCLVAAFVRRGWWQTVGITCGVSLLLFWGLSTIAQPEVFLAQRGGVYLGLALMSVYSVWRGSRWEVRVDARGS